MSLLDMMSGGTQFMKVHVNDIRANPQNFYGEDEENEEIYVADMAEMIAENGQDANGIVYEDTTVADGRHYTLIAGERRWKAITKNFESGKGDGLYEVKVIPKPADSSDEILRIIRNNAQRNKSTAIRKSEIEALKNVWETLKIENRKPEGRMREWIAKNIGMSPRAVQEYLTGNFHEDEAQDQEGDGSDSSDVQDVYDPDKERLEMISANMTAYLNAKTKASKNKKGKFTLAFKADGFDELIRLLCEFGFDDEGNKNYENN